MKPGTLASQLVTRVTVLVAVIAVIVSGITLWVTRAILIEQLDQRVASVGRLARPGDVGRRGPSFRDMGAGQAQGLLIYHQGTGGFVQIDRAREILTDEIADTLEALPAASGPMSVTLPNLGEYRVQIARGTVVGLPTTPVAAAIWRLLGAAGLLVLAAIGVAYAAARRVVQVSLRPLSRLAATAHEVSDLNLTSGEVSVPVRVADADTDPRSEVGQVGLAFNHMLDNVESALDARHRSESRVRQFVADASHELRNPLASIRGYAELTRRNRAELPPDTSHALARIESESERMSALVDDLLLLARLDAGPHLTLEPVGLGAIVADAVSDARAAGPHHRWSVELPEAEVTVLGDRHRLQQVMANLLANARTHTPPGTAVTTSLTMADAAAVIRVADDGPGVPAEVADQIFERFSRADGARARSGGTPSTGLGLAIVAAVVAAHQGTASVTSPPGGGTTFELRIPLARPAG